MNGRPYFRMFAQDWLTSESIQLFTAEQEGAYIRLLAIMWTNKHCALKPESMRALSRYQSSEESFGKILENFVKHPVKPGYVTNPRLYEEFRAYQQYVKRQAESGKKGAEMKRKREAASPEGSLRVASGSVEGKHSQTQTQTHPKKDEEKTKTKMRKVIVVGGEFLEELEKSPKFKLYQVLNIRAEALTAEQWCKDNKRTFSPTMFLNWLKKELRKVQQQKPAPGVSTLPLGLCPSRVKLNQADKHLTACKAQPYQPPQEWPKASKPFCELHYRQWLKIWHPSFLSPELPIKPTNQETEQYEHAGTSKAAT